VSYLNAELNKVEVLPTTKDFETVVCNYPEISPQTFTLISYGDMSELTVNLRKGDLSAFEISSWVQTETTENGGYLVSISVKPKDSLFAATHDDILILSGKNQGKAFSLEVPVSFTVTVSNNRAMPIRNGINLQVKDKAVVETYSLNGVLFDKQNFTNGIYSISLSHLPKGIYVVRITFEDAESLRKGKETLRILVM
jgi:hypothetical protein